MAQQERNQIGNFPSQSTGFPFANPLMTVLADMNGTIMHGLLTAQKDWADFMQRRLRKDVGLASQLANAHSLSDMHYIYAQYWQEAFEQYRKQSEKVVQRSESITQHLAEIAKGNAKEFAQAEH